MQRNSGKGKKENHKKFFTLGMSLFCSMFLHVSSSEAKVIRNVDELGENKSAQDIASQVLQLDPKIQEEYDKAQQTLAAAQDQTAEAEALAMTAEPALPASDTELARNDESMAPPPRREILIEQMPSAEESHSSVSDVKSKESQALDLLSKIDAFTEKDERLRSDTAKAHYNMGNVYYYKGEYEIAAREYYQAVTLMPDDPDSHYNLAFVSGEHLNDHKTAVKHYQMYLYLTPQAKDAALVKEKLLHSQLILKNVIDSPLEEKTK